MKKAERNKETFKYSMRQKSKKDGRGEGYSYLGAGFEGPEGATFKDDPVLLTKDEGHHANYHHQQEERRQYCHNPQVAGGRLHNSYR